MEDAESYYDTDYDILIDSEEEDQLLFLKDGQEVFRFDHQSKSLLDLVNVPLGAKVLDFGCAKATTLKKMLLARPDIEPSVFDVSEMYRSFWDTFISRGCQATYVLPQEWQGEFDLVTSFFSLEHAEDAAGFAESVNSMLKDGGTFYCVVPDWTANIGDIVVIDHPNHFSIESLKALLSSSGFVNINVNDDLHPGALIVHARKGVPHSDYVPSQDTIDKLEVELSEALNFWKGLGDDVASFEMTSQTGRVAIYGSGFYGVFVASLLKEFDSVECFIDKNVFRQNQTLMGKPIMAPLDIPQEIETVYVALNPAVAKKVSEELELMWEKNIIFYIPQSFINIE
jgi:SAM-dependent methyltransferase